MSDNKTEKQLAELTGLRSHDDERIRSVAAAELDEACRYSPRDVADTVDIRYRPADDCKMTAEEIRAWPVQLLVKTTQDDNGGLGQIVTDELLCRWFSGEFEQGDGSDGFNFARCFSREEGLNEHQPDPNQHERILEQLGKIATGDSDLFDNGRFRQLDLPDVHITAAVLLANVLLDEQRDRWWEDPRPLETPLFGAVTLKFYYFHFDTEEFAIPALSRVVEEYADRLQPRTLVEIATLMQNRCVFSQLATEIDRPLKSDLAHRLQIPLSLYSTTDSELARFIAEQFAAKPRSQTWKVDIERLALLLRHDDTRVKTEGINVLSRAFEDCQGNQTLMYELLKSLGKDLNSGFSLSSRSGSNTHQVNSQATTEERSIAPIRTLLTSDRQRDRLLGATIVSVAESNGLGVIQQIPKACCGLLNAPDTASRQCGLALIFGIYQKQEQPDPIELKDIMDAVVKANALRSTVTQKFDCG